MISSIHKKLFYGLRYLLRDNLLCAARARTLSGHDNWGVDRLENFRNDLLLRTLLAAQKRLSAFEDIVPRIPAGEVVSFLQDNYPIIGKADLLEKRALYYPNSGRSFPWTVKGKTSGTTGTPLDIFRSMDSILWENAFIKRHWSWSGYMDGMKRAALRGDNVIPLKQNAPPFWMYNRFNNQLLLSSRHLMPRNMGYIIEALQHFQPYMIQAYPSTAFALARYLENINAPSLAIPCIFTGSEILYPYQRELIERYVGKIMDFYGMAERVAFASECEHGNLHLNSDYSFVEIVDEAGKPTADIGYIVGTTFHNLLMPLVRYRLSDRSKWKPGQCACGRPYPMIEPIAGKFEDVIYGSDGNPVSPSIVTFAFKGVHNIVNSQVAQIEPGIWEIRIVPTSEYSDTDGQQIVRNVHAMVDEKIFVRLRIVVDIPRTSAGKYRWIVNESSTAKANEQGGYSVAKRQ
jgi:phenylacetate-CoA ligase